MGRGRQTWRLVVVLLLSVTAVLSASKWGSEEAEDENENQRVDLKLWDLFHQQAETKCPKVRHTLDEKKIEEMQSCFVEKLDMPAFKRTLGRARDQKAGLVARLRHICGIWPFPQLCLKPLRDTLKRCVPRGERQLQALDSVVRWSCDNTARFINLVADDGFQCYISGLGEFHACSIKALPTRAKTTKETCKFLANFEDCAHAKFSKCNDPNFVPELIQQAAKSLQCRSASAQQFIFHGWYVVPIFIFVKNYYFQ